MAKILKSVAMAAGAGLALGLTSISSSPARARVTAADILDLEPLLDRIESLERRLEILPDAGIADRLREVELRVATDLESFRQETLAACLRELPAIVNDKIDQRIAPIHETLEQHGVALDELREQVATTDRNLQGLIAAIERLVERETASLPAAANGTFQDHLDEALTSERTGLSAKRLPWRRPLGG
jgi:hypothetical protein